MGIYVLQRSLCGGAACFRLKVRGERLKARSFYRFALNFVYVVARGRVVAIVVIVALAGLVVLGAAKPLIRTSSPLVFRLIAYSSNAADSMLSPLWKCNVIF